MSRPDQSFRATVADLYNFAAGTQVVRDVDLLSSATIAAYHAECPGIPRVFRRGEIAVAEPVVQYANDWCLPND